MRLLMELVAVPTGSTIGYGIGRPVDDGTKQVIFAGDARMMVDLGEVLGLSPFPVVAEIEDSQIVAIRELPEG